MTNVVSGGIALFWWKCYGGCLSVDVDGWFRRRNTAVLAAYVVIYISIPKKCIKNYELLPKNYSLTVLTSTS